MISLSRKKLAITSLANDVTNVNKTPTPEGTQQRKRALMPAARKSKKKPKANDGAGDNEDASDPPRRQRTLTTQEMEVALENGYDSDGWCGPKLGTDPKELAAAEEDAVGEETVVETVHEDEEDNGEVVPAPAVHIPITNDDFRKLSVAQLKHELFIRKVGLPRDRRKEGLRKHLKQALEQQLPVFSVAVLGDVATANVMADFAVGAFWEELSPNIDVAEPINVDLPEGRAPTVDKKEAKHTPYPKKAFSRKFKRPTFQGKAKGGPRKSFLKRHGLGVASLPVEFAAEKDVNGGSMLSMEYLTGNLNVRAAMAFAGEATYEEWSCNFTIKELRQHCGAFVLNGLSPSPGIERKFNKQDVANFNQFLTSNLGANLTRRMKQFKAFFGCQDPMKPTPSRKDSPLFKVLPIIKWIRRVGPMSWECGLHLGLDE